MSKDPAVLFYTSDFLSGTFTMTYEQRGKYITLLCLQHQQGHLSEKQMLSICGEKDPEIWCKFQQDASDLFFNQRMAAEVEKRQAHRQKQKENALKRWNKSGICGGNATAMPLENENENINESDIDNKKEGAGRKPFVKPTLEEVTQYCQERNKGVNPNKWLSYYEANGWKVGKNPMKDWKAAVRTWEPEKPKQPETKQSAPIDWSTA